MPRLRNEVTGVIVNVDDATAAQLGPEWGSADKADEKPQRGSRRKAD